MKFKIVYSIIYVFSLLPLRILFIFSDIVYLIVYYLIGYRKKVVWHNLTIAFPEKTDIEKKVIMQKFYRNFCDWIFETLKLCSISRNELHQRITCDYDEFNSHTNNKDSLVFTLGHLFNWEWASHKIEPFINQPICINYLPLANKFANQLLNKIRSRRGAIMISALRFSREFTPYIRKRHTLILIADQRPEVPENGWWTDFFSQPTVFFQGPGKMAHMLNSNLVFIRLTKIKRGYYHGTTHILAYNAQKFSPEELTKIYVKQLETSIRLQPENYMWTHKKWKWTFDEQYQHLKI